MGKRVIVIIISMMHSLLHAGYVYKLPHTLLVGSLRSIVVQSATGQEKICRSVCVAQMRNMRKFDALSQVDQEVLSLSQKLGLMHDYLPIDSTQLNTDQLHGFSLVGTPEEIARLDLHWRTNLYIETIKNFLKNNSEQRAWFQNLQQQARLMATFCFYAKPINRVVLTSQEQQVVDKVHAQVLTIERNLTASTTNTVVPLFNLEVLYNHVLSTTLLKAE